ncbi:hypothetical protein CCH79_00006255 [Gambusia affinis]|uniref:Tetraspanin-4 n=1 Tax=Gambusia affinis TaxID=33528 RepID=A0A315W1R1_GAMAF|nr:hypothetical protein CCH79_00006255 [Gambusia affinis]
MMTAWQSFPGSLRARFRLPGCHILPTADETQRDTSLLISPVKGKHARKQQNPKGEHLKRSRFFILLLLIFFLEILSIMLFFIYQDEFHRAERIDRYAQRDLKKGLQLFGTEGNVGLTNAWMIVQTDFRCCGVTNHTDWFEVYNATRVPDSCCLEYSDNCGLDNPGTWWTAPCYERVKGWLNDNLVALWIFALCTALTQILGLVFSMTMFCQAVKVETFYAYCFLSSDWSTAQYCDRKTTSPQLLQNENGNSQMKHSDTPSVSARFNSEETGGNSCCKTCSPMKSHMRIKGLTFGAVDPDITGKKVSMTNHVKTECEICWEKKLLDLNLYQRRKISHCQVCYMWLLLIRIKAIMLFSSKQISASIVDYCQRCVKHDISLSGGIVENHNGVAVFQWTSIANSRLCEVKKIEKPLTCQKLPQLSGSMDVSRKASATSHHTRKHKHTFKLTQTKVVTLAGSSPEQPRPVQATVGYCTQEFRKGYKLCSILPTLLMTLPSKIKAINYEQKNNNVKDPDLLQMLALLVGGGRTECGKDKQRENEHEDKIMSRS